MWPNPQCPSDFVAFTEEIFNGKLHFCAVDDTTFHACDSDLESRIQRLENESMLAIEWFKINQMKLNNELLLSGYKHEVIWETLARVKCLKTSNENVLVSLLMGT